MNYAEMIQACERAGHDMTTARETFRTKAAPAAQLHTPRVSNSPPAAAPILVTLNLDDIATIIDELVVRIETVEASNADLETRLSALESAAGAKQHSKPVLRVAAGGRRIE